MRVGAPLQRGFSLVELVTVVAVLGVTSALAMPLAGDLVDAQRLRAGITDFVLALRVARGEAAKRNLRVVVCKSEGSGCSRSGDWDQGWVVFQDTNNNALLEAGEPVILRAPPLAAGLHLVGNSPVDDYISFTPTGRTRSTTNALQMGTIRLCKQGSSLPRREIVVNNSGRVNLAPSSLTGCT